MNTTTLIWSVFGIMIGWMLYGLLDYFFWRNRRICTDHEFELESTVSDLQQKNLALHATMSKLEKKASRADDLEVAFVKQKSQYTDLLADFNHLDHKFKANQTDLDASKTQIAGYQKSKTRLNELESQVKERDTAIAKLKSDYEARGAELIGLRERIDGQETELAVIKKQAASLDAQLDSMGIKSDVADGVSANGILASLSNRIAQIGSDSFDVTDELKDEDTISLVADTEFKLASDKDAKVIIEIERLSAELAVKEADNAALLDQLALHQDASITIAPIQDIGIMQVQLEARDAQIEALKAKIDDLEMLTAKEDEAKASA